MSALLLAVLASAPVDQVVLYPDRAQVTRATEVTCGAKVKVPFTGITPAAADDSFRARCEGGTVDGLRVEARVRADEFAPKVKELQAELRKLEREFATVAQQRDRAQQQSRLADRFWDVATTQVSREMATDRPDVKAWGAAFEVALKTKVSSSEAFVAANAALREVQVKIDQVHLKLDGLEASSQRREYVADVVVSCPAGRTARVELTYLVGGASWAPSYEARADDASTAVELSTFATLTQRTGESWDKAQLTLSTAVPAQNATPPELKRLKVNAQKQEPEKKVLVARNEMVEAAQAEVSKPTDSGGLTARAQGLSVQLSIPERATVPGDGTATRVFVNKTRLKATFALRTAPRAMPYVFRVAELTNQAPFPLLAGPVSLFRASGFIARTPLERVAEGAVFRLTFGVDDSVRVQRVALEELKRDVGLFNGKKRFSYSYRFELANYGKKSVDLELSEQVPVSEVDDVVVALSEKTTAGYQLNPADGVASWKVKLNPTDKRNLELTYRVDVPSSYDTGGL